MPRQDGSTRPTSISRRTFLKGSAAAGAAVAGGSLWTTALHPSRARAADTPIEHIIVACQENRSFDHYFGYAPQVQAAGFGPPPGYTPAGRRREPGPSRSVHGALDARRPPHGWNAVHDQWNGGAMDGFYRLAGDR